MHRGLLTRLFVHVYPVEMLKHGDFFFVVREKRTQVKCENTVYTTICVWCPRNCTTKKTKKKKGKLFCISKAMDSQPQRLLNSPAA